MGKRKGSASSDGNTPGGRKAFHVIILGGNGGPIEDDVTALLVRSTATGWAKNSILAVDAGVHLSAMINIIKTHLPGAIRYNPNETPGPGEGRRTVLHRKVTTRQNHAPDYFSPVSEAKEEKWGSPIPQLQNDNPKLVMTTGPFKDLLLPFERSKPNALYLLRYFVSAYLITHAHLDHISGFVINTAAFQHTTRPKKVAALPPTINAIKAHIFNDGIWPNLSDEEGGAGLVSFQRLTEGGNLALGNGEGRGYIEVCDGLAVKGWGVSHGKCMRQHNQRGSINPDFSFVQSGERRGSRSSLPVSPGYSRRKSLTHSELSPFGQAEPCVVDSTAYFILDEHSRKELLVFGDVEPDSISLSPRTHRVWVDAAPKIVAGLLVAIFIECSYDDSQSDETLFGHLTPRHLVAELSSLADRVHTLRISGSSGSSAMPVHGLPTSLEQDPARKRRRDGSERSPNLWGPSESQYGRARSPLSRKTRSSASPATQGSRSSDKAPSDEDGTGSPHVKIKTSPRDILPPSPATPVELTISSVTSNPQSNLAQAWGGSKPLAGIKVVIIHVKDTMEDGPPATDIVLAQLRDRVAAAGLGCEVLIAEQGQELYL